MRRPPQPGVRVRILGPLEARLTDSDRVVLGGLVEGTWPPEPATDAWLSRPMRKDLGLDLPERRIGLSAHDFAQLLGAREVILTRAAKLAGAPTVPSRFVQRLAAMAGERWPAAVARGNVYLDWGRALDRPEQITPLPRPAPKPPRAARPLGLSVTDIEHWLRDPYTIYAKHVLRLAPLDAVDAPPSAAERGTFIHAAVGVFTQRFADGLPADPERELVALGREYFAALDAFPEARAFWWPRFMRIARWFGAWEAGRRPHLTELLAEIRGEIEIPLEAGTFRLRGVADRIERRSDGRYAILDYKTGSARTEKQVRTGLAPQLTLEAAMLRRGGFKPIPAGGSVAELVYVTLKGGEPPGKQMTIDFEDGTPDCASRARAGKTHRAGAPLRRRQRTLSLARPSDVEDALRRLRPSRPGQGMVGDRRRRRRGRRRRMRSPSIIPAAVLRLQSEVSDPVVLRLGRRQCRIGQDPCAGAARHQSPAGGRRAGKNSRHHLHQGGRGQHGEARVRHAVALDHARRCGARCRHCRAERQGAGRAAPGAGATLVCSGAGDAGRAQGADHPRLLHPAPAPVSVRGQCRRALRRARRHRPRAASGADHAHGAARRRRRARQRARPGAGDRDDRRRRPDLPRRGARSDRPPRQHRPLGDQRGRRRRGDRRFVADPRRRSGADASRGRCGDRRWFVAAAVGMGRGRGAVQDRLGARSGAGRTPDRRRRTPAEPSASRPI